MADGMLTAAQIRVLWAIHEYQRKHGESPTRKEVADELGCTEPNVHKIIWGLHKAGAMQAGEARARSLHIDWAIAGPEMFADAVRGWVSGATKAAADAKLLSQIYARWCEAEGIDPGAKKKSA